MSEVTVQVWQVAPRHVPGALVAARTAERRLRRSPAVTFAKVLGTASDAFVPMAVTPRRWAAVTCWRAGADDALTAWFRGHAVETATLSLRPLRSRGTWNGRAPFVSDTRADAWSGRILALTRATVRTTKALRFYRTVPGVAAELRIADGCRLAFGIGEAPVLRQGTISIWDSERAMREFAYSAPQHLHAVRATPGVQWYAEDMFARFAILDAHGSIDGVNVA